MKRFVLILILAFFVFLVPSREMAFAEGGIAWGSAGKPVCTASGNQENMRMVPDDFGGAIIVWEDYRSGNADIYAQRIDKDGAPLWNSDGVMVSTASNSQLKPVIIGDGSGGAIIAWEDYRNGICDIYALRISSGTGGACLGWPPGGVAVSASTTETEQCPDIVAVGVEEVVVVWQQDTGAGDYSIWGQKMTGFGIPSWGGGVIISSGTAPKEFPKIINDGMGYVIVAWQDYTGGTYDIYAHRIDINSGAKDPFWLPNGNPVSDVTPSDQKGPEIVPDGEGGAIITWTDYRDIYGDIYAQRLYSNGQPAWYLNGIPVCKMDREQSNPVIVNSLIEAVIDGAIIAWEDNRGIDSNGDIYAVKVSSDGGFDLTQDAEAIAIGSNKQILPRLVSDGQGGGIGAWIEKDLVSSRDEIFATKRGRYGEPVWNSYPGVLVCEGSIREHQVVKDGSGGIIVVWQAIAASSYYDIFAQRVTEGGSTYSASISGRVTLPDYETGITGVDVWAVKDEKLVSSAITDTKGYYKIVGLVQQNAYLVRANWRANEIESSVSKETFAPSYSFDFTLELDYELATIAGNVSGVGREVKRASGSGIDKSLSPGNGIAFVELEQIGKVIVRVPLDIDGSYAIPNLLPGRFVARAYNGTIYSNSRTVELSAGERLRVDFAFGIMPEETVFNYPNPTRSGLTTIQYYCGYTDPEGEIKIYNIAGELVRKVRDSEISRDGTDPHIYRFLWDCKNSSGKGVASGIYIYIVEAKEKNGNGSKKVVKRMAVIR